VKAPQITDFFPPPSHKGTKKAEGQVAESRSTVLACRLLFSAAFLVTWYLGGEILLRVRSSDIGLPFPSLVTAFG